MTSAAQVDLAMTVTYGRADEATVRLCEGLSRHEDVQRQLAELVETRPSRVTLDLTELGRVSSAGLGVMLAVRRGVVDYAGEVRVASLSAGVTDLFKRTGLDLLFEMPQTEDAMLPVY
jgi:anti-anti-sigma factor